MPKKSGKTLFEHELSHSSELLRLAAADQGSSHVLAKENFLGQACFHAQQTAEKALKAVLVVNQIPYPYVHELLLLAALLPEKIKSSVPLLQDLPILDKYSVKARYDEGPFPATIEDAKEALTIADQILTWAKSLVEDKLRC